MAKRRNKTSSKELTGNRAYMKVHVPGGVDYSDLYDDPRDISEIPEEEREEVSPFTLAMLGFNPRDLDEKPQKKGKKKLSQKTANKSDKRFI